MAQPREQHPPSHLHPDAAGALDPAAAERERAFETVFHAQYPGLCEYVASMVKSNEVAEDLVQDLFVRLWERHADASTSSLTQPYLYTAARNRAIGYLRRQRVAQRWADEVIAAEEPSEETSASLADARELEAAIAHAVASLPPRCRLIFTMSRVHGLSYGEIARSLDVSQSTVETQMSRALKRLRAYLAPFLGLALAVVHVIGASGPHVR